MSEKRFGPYLVNGVLGRGGMGTVFRATEDETDKNVAVKVLSTAFADDPHFRSRFESEIQTLLQLDHPNIVRLIGHGEEDGNLFFAMELVEGKSLHELQRSGHKFTWQEVMGIAMDVCAGLQHAHYRGIVHRDIKPANLIKCTDGTTKITDYGIAKLFGAQRLTQHGGAIGTADYMSPEQARGVVASERSDLFSLGCVMYALLTGRPPFAEKNVQATIASLANKDPVPLRRYSPETPAEFEELIHRLLAKKPEDRFGTAQALNRRLVDLLEIIKADAEAQTAVALELDDEVDDYRLSPADQTVAPKAFTAKIKNNADTFAEPVDDLVENLEGDQTIVETEKTDYFKVVERKKKSSAEQYESSTTGPIWPYAVAMVAVLGLILWGVLATVYSRPNADQLFEQISTQESPSRAECEAFMERFPDDQRVAQVEAILAEIESRKLEKKLTLAKKIRGIRSMYPIEILLLAAIETRKNNPVDAIERLDALIMMYDGDEELSNKEQETLTAAFFFRRRFKNQAETFIEKHRNDVSRALDRAQAKVEEGEAQLASDIYRGIISNFRDQQWAKDLVAKAESALGNIPSEAQPKEIN